jgi:iron complex outermembrane recepter protein
VNADHRATRPLSVRAAVTAILGTSAALVLPGLSLAQEQPAKESQIEEITVTGSRILRKDFEATSPIVTVNSEAFENTSNVALEANLNKLPQFVPAVSQFTTTDVQNTATNTVGASTVSLRGLGPNRNLVLLDGRRAMPVNASMVVDINSIPSAALERVEVTTGGASSVYGADAVGGVVNFILKKNFQGMQFDAQYGTTSDSDGEELRVSGLLGANFAEGRGNVLFGIEHYDRQAAAQVDRDFYLERMADPTVNSTEFFYSDTAYAPSFFNPPAQSTVNGIFSAAAPGTVTNTGAFFANKDGTLYTGGNTFGGGVAAGAYRYNGVLDNQFRKILANGTIGENQQANLISIPLQRWSTFGRAHFDMTENVTFFGQANFNRNSVQTILQFSPASNGWSALIPYGTGVYAPSLGVGGATNPDYLTGGRFGLSCPATGGCTNSQAFPVPAELATLLNSRVNPNDSWQVNRSLDFLGPRASKEVSDNFQITSGLEGNIPGNDWTWEAYASHGETSVQIDLQGFADLQRYRAVVSSPNYGRGLFLTGNQGPPGFGFGAATGTCTSGLPIFGTFDVSEDCKLSVNANLQNNTRMKQDIVEANMQGGLFNLPAGQLRFALGTSYRENTFVYETDILTSQQSFLDSAIGLFPAGNSKGRTSSKEVYGELLVPVISEVPAFKRLSLELGYRYSDYNIVGANATYKGILDWVVTDSIRFRGGKQRAVRAPNIGELFLGRTQSIVGTSFGDFCSRNSTAPDGNGPGNPNRAQAEAICRTLMGAAGAATYYAGPQAVGSPGIAIGNTVGNMALDPETADTYTAGFVLSSPWEGALKRLTASIDWYSIEISDAISPASVDSVFAECLGVAGNPTGNPNTPACQSVVRDPNTGGPGAISVAYSNQAHFETSGVDLQVDWSSMLTDLGMQSLPGTFSVNVLFNYLDSFKTKAGPVSPEVEWKGTLGPDTPGLNPGAFDWKLFTTFNYFMDKVSGSLRWRHLPSIDSLTKASVPASPLQGAASYDIFDLSGTWQVTPTIGLRAGIDNLLDKQPPVVDRNPTVVQSGGNFETSPGYYDVLGRRYYLGFRAQF